jgi:rhodanese-related sulfurtransferase
MTTDPSRADAPSAAAASAERASAERAAAAAASDRAVVCVFDDRVRAEEAVDALLQAGFAHDKVGYVIRGADAVAGGMITDAAGAKDAKGAVAGALTGGVVGGVLAAAVSLLIPGVGPVLAGGILASFFGGAIAGTAVGGILGAMAGLGISEEEARHYEKAFHEGRAIVAVKAGARAADASEILLRTGGRNVHAEAHSPVRTHGTFSTP